MENTVCLNCSTKICQLGTNLPPKQAAQLVQSSFAKRYLMKAILAEAWAVAVVIG
jgi:hypothetical protein